MPETTDQHDLLDRLAEEFVSRRRQGERASIEEYERQYPDLAEEIRDIFPTMLELEQLKVHKAISSGGTPASIGPVPLTRLGDFRILREIGRGGMGVVYEAEQESLHRRVALKVLGTQLGMSARQKARFRREAEAAARLHHTNIVPIFGVGEDQGLQFYAMQFIEGVPLSRLVRAWRDAAVGGPSPDKTNPPVSSAGSLSLVGAVHELLGRDAADSGETPSGGAAKTLIDESEGPAVPSPLMQVTLEPDSCGAGPARVVVQQKPSAAPRDKAEPAPLTPREHRAFWQEIVRIVIDVAQALGHAHHLGILHRDVKPANLLLDTTGAIWVTDFGLAKVETQDHTITRSGDFIGTLRYVAPEQLHGNADRRSDVYSLGLTLFELLTLQPAFADEPLAQIMQRQTRELPKKPCAINPLIPRDLETITLKACATDPAHRYQSAEEFAADLRRFAEDRPIHARPVTWIERTWRWSRKNPIISALGSISALLLLSLVTVLGIANYKIGAANEQLEQSVDAAKKSAAEAQTERALADANLQLAVQAFEDIMDNVASRGSPVSLVSEDEASGISEPVDVSPADARLLERLLEFFERFAKQNQKDLTSEMAAIRSRIGDIQLRLGRSEEAKASYLVSIESYDSLRKSRAESMPLLLEHAKAFNRLGVAYSVEGRIMEAFDAHHKARQLLEQSASNRDVFDVQLDLAETMILADTVFIRSGAVESFSALNRSSDRPPPPPGANTSEGPPRRPPPPDGRFDGRGRGDRGPGRGPGDSGGKGRNRPEEWSRGLDMVVDLLEKLRVSHPNDSQVRLLLARAYRNRHYALRMRMDLKRANSDLQTAVDLMTHLEEQDPKSPTYRFELADLLCIPPATSFSQTPDEETTHRLERAIQISEQLLSESPTVPEYQALLGSALKKLAAIEYMAQKYDPARVHYRRAIELQKSLVMRYPSTRLHHVAYVNSLAGLADVDKEQGQVGEARAGLERAIVVLKDYQAKHKDDWWIGFHCERLERRLQKWMEPTAPPMPTL
jgi:serine/threonine protein kinase